MLRQVENLRQILGKGEQEQPERQDTSDGHPAASVRTEAEHSS